MKKVCAVCGREFEAIPPKRICCSPECAKARQRQTNSQWIKTHRNKGASGIRPKRGWRKAECDVYDADGKHRRFRERAMRREPWKYEFADSPELLS